MQSRLLHHISQLRERLWAKPLLYCVFAVGASFAVQWLDYWVPTVLLPEITPETVEKLLTIISSSMLTVATFAVGSMLASYTSASASATPRAFALVLADDVSQTALSSFIGAFIFSIIAIVALKTGFYEESGVFGVFVLTLAIFTWVVLTFVRWVDNIARLGRLGTTIDKAEAASLASLRKRRKMPYLGGVAKTGGNGLGGARVHCDAIGYVRHVDISALQAIAVEHDIRIMVDALPGVFLAPGRPVAVIDAPGAPDETTFARIANAFVIGDNRSFEEDPRFGLIVLSEIAARALSPGINDPGTAIVILGRFVRVLAAYAKPVPESEKTVAEYDRVIVPALSLDELFDDAFTAITRDGAGAVEVGIRAQKAFLALSTLDQPGFATQAKRHSDLALARARTALSLDADLARIEKVALLVR